MIAEKHYTKNGEHPEDRIFRDREYIKRLQEHINDIFGALSKDLRLNEMGQEYLFDYVYNDDRDIEFEEYINNASFEYDEFYSNNVKKTKKINK